MYRVNYLPPEQMPSHQRDFPREGQAISTADGSRPLGTMVVGYLVAMLGGILLLGYLTAPAPNTSIATIAVPLKK